MVTEMISISKEEYDRLKLLNDEIDFEVVDGFKKGLEELKEEKVIEFKKNILFD